MKSFGLTERQRNPNALNPIHRRLSKRKFVFFYQKYFFLLEFYFGSKDTPTRSQFVILKPKSTQTHTDTNLYNPYINSTHFLSLMDILKKVEF